MKICSVIYDDSLKHVFTLSHVMILYFLPYIDIIGQTPEKTSPGCSVQCHLLLVTVHGMCAVPSLLSEGYLCGVEAKISSEASPGWPDGDRIILTEQLHRFWSRALI